MKKIFLIIYAFAFVICSAQQPAKRNEQFQKVDTVSLNLADFSKKIIGNETDDYQKARKLLYWLSTNLDWKPTDYVSRTVKEILARGGGNCFELATVYMSLIKEAGIVYRGIAEVMIYPISPRRQANAAAMIRKNGFRSSVFGMQHNDHRWVEIYDSKNNQWHPADPTMGVIGITEWMKARMIFGVRQSLDTANSNEMITSAAIFVTEKNAPTESRTAYYLINAFDAMYDGKLSKFPLWNEWIIAVNELTEPCKNAFLAKENLHLYQDKFARLAQVYNELKKLYLEKYNDTP